MRFYDLVNDSENKIMASFDNYTQAIENFVNYIQCLFQNNNKEQLEKVKLIQRMKYQFCVDDECYFYLDLNNFLIKRSSDNKYIELSFYCVNKLMEFKDSINTNNLTENNNVKKNNLKRMMITGGNNLASNIAKNIKPKEQNFEELLKNTLKDFHEIKSNTLKTKKEEKEELDESDICTTESLSELDSISSDENEVPELKSLKELQKESKKVIDKNKKEHMKIEEKLADEKLKIQDKQIDLDRQKFRLEEKKNIFKSERDYTFKKIKTDIEEGKLSEENISPLFLNKYLVYQYMDENDFLYDENSFEIFNSLLKDLEETNSLDNEVKNILPDEIHSRFNSKNINTKSKLKSLDEILKNVDNELENMSEETNSFKEEEEKYINEDSEDLSSIDEELIKNNNQDNITSDNNEDDNLSESLGESLEESLFK